MSITRYFCPILTKFGLSRQIFVDDSSTKCHWNPPSWRCAVACRQTDGVVRRISRLQQKRLRILTLIIDYSPYSIQKISVYLTLDVKCQILFLDVKKFRASRKVFLSPQSQISRTSVQWGRYFTIRADGNDEANRIFPRFMLCDIRSVVRSSWCHCLAKTMLPLLDAPSAAPEQYYLSALTHVLWTRNTVFLIHVYPCGGLYCRLDSPASAESVVTGTSNVCG